MTFWMKKSWQELVHKAERVQVSANQEGDLQHTEICNGDPYRQFSNTSVG
jgi:hypothetical protein